MKPKAAYGWVGVSALAILIALLDLIGGYPIGTAIFAPIGGLFLYLGLRNPSNRHTPKHAKGRHRA